MAGSGDDNEVRQEFLSEAQEIVEALSKDLLLLDKEQRDGRYDPDLLNDIFRSVHTLKGLAGMFGIASLQSLSHTLENLLDDLRLGRIDLTQEILDVLFEGVENTQRLLSSTDDNIVDLDKFAQVVDRVAEGPSGENDALQLYAIEESVLSVLTEYEEHRLRANVEKGNTLFRLCASFPLASIDSQLEELKSRAKPHAELITYLPTMGQGSEDVIDLDVLLASSHDLASLIESLCDEGATLAAIPLREDGATAAAAASPATPIVEPASAEVAGPAEPEHPAETRGDTVAPSAEHATVHVSAHPEPEPEPQAAMAPAGASPPASPPAAGTPRSPGGGGGGGGTEGLSLRSVANTVRVNIDKLDHLMNVVGELAIVRSAVSQMTERVRERSEMRHLSTELHRISRTFERNLEELQDGILDVRMVPLGQVFDKLGRVVRQAARDNRKDVRLQVSGAETEVDKLIVEELSDPLMHIIRNAIDHGIEDTDARKEIGKKPQGTLRLRAYQKGNHVMIEVEDDGAGMDPSRLVDKALEKGLLTEEASREVNREDSFNLIFLPGFSTSESVTDLSGRGVGMDVVKTNISKLGGVIDVHSEVGMGTIFTITLPITLAIISALVVRVGSHTYAIPLANVQEALLLDDTALRTVEGREVMTLRGGTLPLCRLRDLFHLSPLAAEAGERARQFVVVSALGNRRLGVVVDLLHGQRDIVIKPLGKSLSQVRGFAGATDLGDQRVALVLDTPQLLEEMLTNVERARMAEAAP